MVNLLILVGIVVGICIVGGGGAYFLWVITRPKKITWNAEVYQLGGGIKPPVRDRAGRIISDVKLSDLRPYTKDVIEKIDKEPGIVIYRLQKLNKVVPAVTSDCVDYWGEKNKKVAILMDGDTCTILKKGYNRDVGMIFEPMPHSRINMLKGEIAIRKDRLRKEKDILQAITPWIITGICMVALIGLAYVMGATYTKISENLKESLEYQSDKVAEAARVLGCQAPEPEKEVVPELPPSVE